MSLRLPEVPGGGRKSLAGFDMVLWAVFLACLLPELVFLGASLDLWGTPRWRLAAYQYAGFWSGLLGSWRPNYLLQPYLMFATYGFLHAGPVHLAVNMLTLFSLGQPILERIGRTRFLALLALSLVGGGVAFAALSTALAPMVGASGALFGLAGALLAWEFAARKSQRAPLWPVLRAVLWLTVLNLVLWWAMHGQLAWETHLGGFLTGAAFALFLARRV